MKISNAYQYQERNYNTAFRKSENTAEAVLRPDIETFTFAFQMGLNYRLIRHATPIKLPIGWEGLP